MSQAKMTVDATLEDGDGRGRRLVGLNAMQSSAGDGPSAWGMPVAERGRASSMTESLPVLTPSTPTPSRPLHTRHPRS